MIGIISDIHGNFIALNAALRKMDQLGVKQIFCLGDVVGYYSQVNECCDELRERNIQCVMGNHDWYMVAGSFCPRSQSVNDCLKYQRKVITEENLVWLSSFPLYRREKGVFMVHGGWSDPIDEYLKPSQEYFARVKGRVFVSGHSHIQQLNIYREKIYCNPGSVGQPRDGDNRAAFAVYEAGEFSLHRVSYDIEQVGVLMEKAGFSGYYYGCLSAGAARLGWKDKQKENNAAKRMD